MAYDENIRIIAEELERLKNHINALDVEIPPHVASDVGKVLTVDSEGDLEWNNEIPSYAVADSGKILAVDSEGELEWKEEYSYTPPAYSTEEVNTGKKWIDGRDIYCKVFYGTFPEITSSTNVTIGTLSGADLIINEYSIIKTASANINNRYYTAFYTETYELQITNVATSYSGRDYVIIVYYTKVEPAPSTETKKKGAK